ncbi:hypothetical protein [Candidatus Hakubella thermalkaliphila]|nr:hypothetical protein [Candidatus Hakubella thermalkaliphila]
MMEFLIPILLIFIIVIIRLLSAIVGERRRSEAPAKERGDTVKPVPPETAGPPRAEIRKTPWLQPTLASPHLRRSRREEVPPTPEAMKNRPVLSRTAPSTALEREEEVTQTLLPTFDLETLQQTIVLREILDPPRADRPFP